MKHRYYIYGVNNKGEFIRGTCLDYGMSHCINLCEKQGIKIHKIEYFNFETADLPVGIEKIEKLDFKPYTG